MKTILSTIFALTLILTFGSSTASAATVSATGLTFGTIVVGNSGNATAAITVNAASGTPYTVTLDAGTNYSSGVRNVKSGATIGASYHLYKDAAHTAEWGDAGFANTYSGGGAATGVAGTGSGADQLLTVYAAITANTTPGAYNDSVTVTVNY
ncbi:MAG: spore coat protein U domain-containing protein [Deltaproteobacteria bacterium]|nr:spore coat protein U domain-containing protein [Deltaproteobacteria bacterium]